MSNQHKYLAISDIQGGMVLYHDIVDKQGHVLLPAGSVLNDLMISSLRAHEIHQVSILLGEVCEAINESEQTRAHQLQRLTVIFRHAPFEEPRNSLATYIQSYREGEIHE